MIAPDGVSFTTKFPEVSPAIEREVNTREVVPSVMLSVTSFHPVSWFTVPIETYTTASAISLALSASVERVGAPEAFTV